MLAMKFYNKLTIYIYIYIQGEKEREREREREGREKKCASCNNYCKRKWVGFDRFQSLHEDVCISHGANTKRRDINPTLLPRAMSK